MHSPIFEEAYPVARDLAHGKAVALVGCFGLTYDDCEDLEADLLFAFWSQFTKFDSRRASLRTFASRVMDRRLTSNVRRWRALCRAMPPSGSPVQEQNGGSRESEGRLEREATPSGISPLQQREFQIDVDRVLHAMPAPAREVVQALSENSLSESARLLGRSRPWLYEQIARLRQAFEAAGIERRYFSPAGGVL
ncbi:MAG: hypothetical protein M1436_05040 [Acidobacteria bacterium]|nr:hypothetical protein [Acidobacteriota bacterium]